jgi:aryl-alcohol dehydrogenase-like predicted oxidoreductase
MVSTVGFGGYRIHEFEPDHREALRLALLSGCNLIDTSSNYTDGSSERLIGQVTTDLFECGALKREQIVFVTKAGYVQGQNLKEARLRKERGEGFPDMVEFQPDCWHNISPAFLEDQIGKSLERLRLSTIDILLLHNPEYFLKASGARETYYQRIEQAFRHLEGECQKGRIRYYGISSNTFPEDEARSDFTSLSRVVEIAESIALESGKKHHFAVAQMPFNLFEPGAALSHNNHRKSVLYFAEKKNLGILVNRPLNSFSRGRLTRLTSFASHDAVEVKGGLHVTLGRAIELEKTAPGAPKAGQGLQWAHVLRDRLGELDDLLTWKEALYMQIMPSIRQALSRLNADRSSWSTEYQEVMQKLFDLISCDLENLAHQKSTVLDEQISQFAPELKEAPTLSQKVLRLYLSFPQISSVLVGMRTPDYVKDTLHAATAPTSTADHALTVLSRFQRHRS